MNILIVGEGAVGLVYGHCFQQAGHSVTFFIKEKHRATLNQGVTLVRKRRLWRDNVSQFSDFSLISDWQAVGKQQWDQVLLAIPSDALRQLPFDSIYRAICDATLVMLQPSEEDSRLLLRFWPASQVVRGMINLISYYHPLPGETPVASATPLSIAWFLPPTAMPLSGDKARLDDVLSLFNGSGIYSKSVANALASSRFPNAVLMTFLCALDASDWRFAQLRSDRTLLALLVAAQKDLLEALAANEAPQEQKAMKRAAGLLGYWPYRMILGLAPLALPFSLEAYLREHFTKVRSQTDLYVQDFRRHCDSVHLAQLHQRAFVDIQTVS